MAAEILDGAFAFAVFAVDGLLQHLRPRRAGAFVRLEDVDGQFTLIFSIAMLACSRFPNSLWVVLFQMSSRCHL
jgi:hypothetical protein